MQLTDLLLSTLALASASIAQGTNSDVKVHVVTVGANSSLKFSPEELTVDAGDMVQFQFYPKNHSIVQSTFDAPCVPMSKTMGNMSGFKSGFMPVAADDTEQPVFTIMVNDTKPIWVYCGQTGHCQKGMVMAINVNTGSNKTLAAYKALARNFSSSSSSGSGTGSGSGSGSSSSDSTGSSSSSGRRPSSSNTSTATGTAQTTNAAPKPVVNALGLVGLFVAGLSFLGL